jgi:hypothetical protein
MVLTRTQKTVLSQFLRVPVHNKGLLPRDLLVAAIGENGFTIRPFASPSLRRSAHWPVNCESSANFHLVVDRFRV